MDIPKTKTVKLSQAERFIIGLREIANECGMSGVDYNALGIIKLYFNDGSSVGELRLFREAGIIK